MPIRMTLLGVYLAPVSYFIFCAKMSEGVKVFLAHIEMTKYYSMFITKGFDLESDIPHLTSHDLEDVLLVSSHEDRSIILSSARSYCPSVHAVREWLRSNSLDYYYIAFVQSDLTDLKKIAHLSLPDEDLYDELEIVLPGHRKRLERAVLKLKHDQQNAAGDETPVTQGWWGKPECLPQAKFDFLCVRAFLFSHLERQNKVSVDFMVDSGSDVSTVQEDILRGLNLELIGPIYSCGIHGGNHTNLYRAWLMIGDQELDIEIMASNYNSLGSRVVRHFRHVINGHEHIWLKGNYKDELPAILPLPLPVVSSDPQHSQVQVFSESNNQLTKIHGEHQDKDLENSLEKSPVKDHLLNNIPKFSSEAKSQLGAVDVHQENISSVASVSADNTCDSLKRNKDRIPPCFSSDKPSRKGKKGLKSERHKANKSVLKRSISTPCKIPSSVSENKETENSVNGNNSLQPHSSITEHSNSHNSYRNGNSSKPGSNSGTLKNSTETKDLSSNGCSDKRVSFRNIIPPSLRDTDDDIDHMNLSTSSKVNTQIMYSSKMAFSNEILEVENSQNAENVNEDIIHINVSDEEDDDDENKDRHGFALLKASRDIMLISVDELELPQQSDQLTAGCARKSSHCLIHENDKNLSHYVEDNIGESERESLMGTPKKRSRLDQ